MKTKEKFAELVNKSGLPGNPQIFVRITSTVLGCYSNALEECEPYATGTVSIIQEILDVFPDYEDM